MEEEEIKRLQKLTEEKYGRKITKLEASALLTKKSKKAKMADSEVISFLDDIQGVTRLPNNGGLFL